MRAGEAAELRDALLAMRRGRRVAEAVRTERMRFVRLRVENSENLKVADGAAYLASGDVSILRKNVLSRTSRAEKVS